MVLFTFLNILTIID